jgi:transglycosylase-like protein with SLT domain
MRSAHNISRAPHSAGDAGGHIGQAGYMRASAVLVLLVLLLLRSFPTLAYTPYPPGQVCRQHIEYAERHFGIPPHLLVAMGHVESGRLDPQKGTWEPWPWTINVEGKGYFFETKQRAIAAVNELLAHGIRSIDVGCMQVNLLYHPNAFADLDDAFDPRTNAIYAARFLRDLFQQTGNWTNAAALYHSATPVLAANYQKRVLAAWPEAKRRSQREDMLARLAAAWAATLDRPENEAETGLAVIPRPIPTYPAPFATRRGRMRTISTQTAPNSGTASIRLEGGKARTDFRPHQVVSPPSPF